MIGILNLISASPKHSRHVDSKRIQARIWLVCSGSVTLKTGNTRTNERTKADLEAINQSHIEITPYLILAQHAHPPPPKEKRRLVPIKTETISNKIRLKS